MGCENGVKDSIGKDVLAIVEVVVGRVFCVNVNTFYCVKMCAVFFGTVGFSSCCVWCQMSVHVN